MVYRKYKYEMNIYSYFHIKVFYMYLNACIQYTNAHTYSKHVYKIVWFHAICM